MDWSDTLVFLGGFGGIAAAIGFVLKRSFERLLDVRFKRVEEQSRVTIEELGRRQAALFDEQYSALKMVAALIYRARNVAREMCEGNPDPLLADTLHTYHTSIEMLLYAERAIMPADIFAIAHAGKHLTRRIIEAHRDLQASSRRFGATEGRQEAYAFTTAHELLKGSVAELDQTYLRLTAAVQGKIGVTAPENQRLYLQEEGDRQAGRPHSLPGAP